MKVAALGVLAALALAPPSSAFDLGVASGDVRPASALLWTRADRAGAVTLEVWRPGAPPQRREVRAELANDLTVTVEVSGLRPWTPYRYRFRQGSEVSPVGRFRTAPTPTQDVRVRFTWSGDSDGTIDPKTGAPGYGAFAVLDAAAAERPHFFVYLGDTIYADFRADGKRATTLAEYRALYRQSRKIAALRNLEAQTSIVAQWDDHEVVNDWDSETVPKQLLRRGLKAFREYQPLAPRKDGRLYRSFRWGKHLEVFVLDERSYRSAEVDEACANPPGSGASDQAPLLPQAVRDQFKAIVPQLGLPVPESCKAALLDPDRTFLGAEQLAWLRRGLARSTATWKVVMTGDPIQEFALAPYDRWEGYAAERAELLSAILALGIENVVWLATDVHATLVKDVTLNGAPTGMIEVVTGPIGTATFAELVASVAGPAAAAVVGGFLKGLGARCVELDEFSYGVVSAGPKRLTIDSRGAEGRSVCGRGLWLAAE